MILNDDTRNFKLTLSSACYERLENDSNIHDITKSELIERVICDYCTMAGNTGGLREMYSLLAEGRELRFFRTISSLLIANGTQVKRRHSFASSRSYNWTITEKARTKLTEDRLSDSESGGSFITDILEEYSFMNYAVREKIIMRDKISVIEKAIKNSFLISFSSKGKKDRKTIAPCKIMTDTDGMYNYVLGCNIGTEGQNRLGDYRIFSMTDINIELKKYKTDINAVEKEISGRNIAYLWGEERDDIVVALTDDGEKNYNLVVHNRPLCINKEETGEDGRRKYHFRCTEFQAQIYFSSFGKNAKVINPASLAEKMKSFYGAAVSVYDEA